DIIFKTRELVANILNVKYPTSIVFTANATESLNSIIDGFLSEGDTVVTTAIEHNSVIRPLIRLKHEKGINIKWIKSDEFGYVNPDEVVKH
ncbi:aminotransferase class V-fold PLP-dependent enzyme, partial [Streptomyces scabiei]